MRKILIFMALSFACVHAKSQSKTLQNHEIDTLVYFEPYARISLVVSGNKQIPDDSLSVISKDLQAGLLNKYAAQIRLGDRIQITNSTLQDEINGEMFLLQKQALKHRNHAEITITPVIDSVLIATHHRFALFTAGLGFTRENENYRSQKEKDIAVDILSLGTLTSSSYKAASEVYVIIVDSQNKNIAYFNQWIWFKKEPLDENVLEEQFQKLLVGYFK